MMTSTLGTQHRNTPENKNPVLTHPVVLELASKYKRSVAEVVLSWAFQLGMSVIPRSTQETHIVQLARLLQQQDHNNNNNNNGGFLHPEDVRRMEHMKNSA